MDRCRKIGSIFEEQIWTIRNIYKNALIVHKYFTESDFWCTSDLWKLD